MIVSIEAGRKIYDPVLGKLGDEFVDGIVEDFQKAGIKVLSVAGKTVSKYSPADVTIEIGDKSVRLQIEKRFHTLEHFLTVHLPKESLDFNFLIESSLSGNLFMTTVDYVKISPLVDVPNKYGGEHEPFYNIPSEAFTIFSREHFIEWWKSLCLV
jgi:hypothetical protein